MKNLPLFRIHEKSICRKCAKRKDDCDIITDLWTTEKEYTIKCSGLQACSEEATKDE